MIEENNQTTMPETADTASAQETSVEQPVTQSTEKTVSEKEPTYTKSQVIEMMKKRVNRSHQAFFNRYKVKDLAEMDRAFAKIAEYEAQIADLGVTNAGLVKNNAYLTHGIDPERYDDIEAYFKGKDMKIDSDTLAQEIITHPHWKKQVVQPAPQTTIKTLSPERGHNIVESDDEKMKRVFGLK